MSIRYLSSAEVARALGVLPETLSTWCNLRDTPEPDILWGRQEKRGWHPMRLPEWRRWYETHLRTRNGNYIRTTPYCSLTSREPCNCTPQECEAANCYKDRG